MDNRPPTHLKLNTYDEGRHHSYFRSLLQIVWPALDARQRRIIGPALPDMIFAFLEPDYPATAVALIDSGLSGHEAEQVLLESFPRPAVQRYLRASADATVRYLRAEGVLEDPETHESFARAGLIDASTQHPLTSRSNPPWHGMSNDENLRLPTADDLAAFDRDGFVVLRDALPGNLSSRYTKPHYDFGPPRRSAAATEETASLVSAPSYRTTRNFCHWSPTRGSYRPSRLC
ncbi:diiron oxygenase [Micromonospora craniellae]|nr:diiron oxygenase [Micromonospora craniellae]